MKTVWVVEKGEYSDYRVVGVFSTKENAERVRDIENADEHSDATVAEWPLDPAITELNQGLTKWLVHMRKDGETERCDRQDGLGYQLESSFIIWERSKAVAYSGRSDKPDLMIATVWASDEKHAVKIANEKRTEWIAIGKW